MDCRAALKRGIAALCRLQEDGCWRGFPTLAGRSDVWVTAFVVAHLRALAPRHAALAKARAYLAAQRWPHSGWSYGGEVPPDADSTAWCLMALRGGPQLKPQECVEAEEFLTSHQTEQGTATYGRSSDIRRYIGAGPSVSLAGWTAPHADVTAAALLAGVPRLASSPARDTLGRLAARQTGAGFLDAYWWRGPFYTTTLVVRAADRMGYRLPRARAKRILAALDREQLEGGGFPLGGSLSPDPFTTALALECYTRLAYLGGAQGRRAAARTLLRLQRDDGGWSGEYVMRIPAPDVFDPAHVRAWSRATGGGNSYVLDAAGIFASTLACFALANSRTADVTLKDKPELTVSHKAFPDDDVVTLSR